MCSTMSACPFRPSQILWQQAAASCEKVTSDKELEIKHNKGAMPFWVAVGMNGLNYFA